MANVEHIRRILAREKEAREQLRRYLYRVNQNRKQDHEHTPETPI